MDPECDISVVRIAVDYYPFKGGSNIHTRDLAEKIHPHLRRQVIIAHDYGEMCSEFDEQYHIPIVRVQAGNLQKKYGIPVFPLNNLIYMIRVAGVIKNLEDIDLIHAHNISNIGFSWFIGKMLGIPVIGMMHGTAEANSRISGVYESIMATLFKPAFALILDDGSVAPEKYRRLWGDRITVVHHAIDTDMYAPAEKSTSLLEELGIARSDFVALSTSSFLPVKNVDFTIDAFASFLATTGREDAHLILAGDGRDRETIEAQANERGIEDAVRFVGYQTPEKLLDYLSISDVIVGSSLYSNMNRSIQEAMACEIPPVVFDSGGTGSVVRHRENGILVEPGNVGAFAEALSLLYRDPALRERLGKKARATILEDRNWDRRIRQELAVYRKCMEMHRPETTRRVRHHGS
ncbi:MAG TPA: glycosyltransferase family 1 protein [Methanoculleus sp.]|nr:glycosyltransferase family 1 protein [Methanoculleus sp.]